MFHGAPELLRRDEAGRERARGCFDDHTGVSADVGNVSDRPGGRRNPHSETVGHFVPAWRPRRRVEFKGTRILGSPGPMLTGQREMDFM